MAPEAQSREACETQGHENNAAWLRHIRNTADELCADPSAREGAARRVRPWVVDVHIGLAAQQTRQKRRNSDTGHVSGQCKAVAVRTAGDPGWKKLRDEIDSDRCIRARRHATVDVGPRYARR